MSDKQLLDKIAGIIVANNKVLLEAVGEKIKASEEKQTKELIAKIDESREDIIEVFMDVVNTGYKMTDKRLKKVEDKLGISSSKPQ
jgi:NADH:ubiquinone oxidoreductase subunit E